ncbi:MAG: 7-cyano-7-deazaguanine synthase, partial [Planctomycetota bacterium]
MARRSNKAVALLSGGLDSVVATAAAARSGGVVLALTFDYGQRSRKREAAAARSVARALGVKWKRVALPWLAELIPESMRRAGKGLPRPREAELDDPSRRKRAARSVWVPNRNGVFLNIAAAYAEHSGARAVVAGFNREEARAFPDSSPE